MMNPKKTMWLTLGGLTLATAIYWANTTTGKQYIDDAIETIKNPRAAITQKSEALGKVDIYIHDGKTYACLASSPSKIYEIERVRVNEGETIDGLVYKYNKQKDFTVRTIATQLNKELYGNRWVPQVGDSRLIPVKEVKNPTEVSAILSYNKK